jgi:hypothetical protein
MLHSWSGFQCKEWSERLGLAVEAEQCDPEHFGDALLVLANPEIRLRLVRDRGQLFVDVAAPGTADDWWDLPLVLELAGDPLPRDLGGVLPSPAEALAVIERHYARIVALFSPEQRPHTLPRLAALRRRRAESRLGAGSGDTSPGTPVG